MISRLLPLGATLILALTACISPPDPGTTAGHGHEHGGHGHGGHGEDDHGDHADHGHGEGNVKLTQFDNGHELFVEIEPMAAGKPSTYTAHVTRLVDNHPATMGTMSVRFLKEGQEQVRTLSQAPARLGIFEFPAHNPEEPGDYTLEIAYSGHGDTATWTSTQTVHKTPQPAEELGGEDLSFTKEQQWNIPFSQEQVRTQEVGRVITVAAVIDEDPRLAKAILSPAAGYFAWSEAFVGASVGTRVSNGQQLATLRPDVPEEHWSKLEEAVEIAQVDLASAKAEQERVKKLVAGGLVQAKELLAAEANVKQAKVAESNAYKERKRIAALVDQGLLPGKRLAEVDARLASARVTRQSMEAEQARLAELLDTQLLQEKDLIAAQGDVDKARAAHDSAQKRLREKSGESDRQIAIVSPIDGFVSELLTEHGHQVEKGAPVAHVVSTGSVLLHIEVSMFDVERLAAIGAIWLRRPGQEQSRSLESLGGEAVTDTLVFDPGRLTARLTYRIRNENRFRLGEYVEAQLMIGSGPSMPVVRESAIVEINTIPYVFVALSGESYARRRVVRGNRVGDFVAIENGLEPGEWAVTTGGFDLYVSSLASSLQSHQH